MPIRPAARSTARGPERPAHPRPERPGAVGDEPAVPSADGLRGRHGDHRPFRAGARPRRALVVASRRRQRRDSSCGGCASIRMRCATATRSTARTKKALLFGYFPVSIKDASATRRARWSSPACRTTSSRTRRRTRCSTACIPASTSRSIPTCWLSTKPSPTSSRCSSTSPIRACCATRSRARAATSPARTCSASSRSSSAQASGRGSALRDALGANDPATGKWAAHKPDVHALDQTHEPHDRGAILVAAVFGAFLKVYRARTADLYRIATEGTGVLREGDIHPDLANRLADEAARCAHYVLQMCIRAIDYCPPVGHHVRRLSARASSPPTTS